MTYPASILTEPDSLEIKDISPKITLSRKSETGTAAIEDIYTLNLRCNSPPQPIYNAQSGMYGEELVLCVETPPSFATDTNLFTVSDGTTFHKFSVNPNSNSMESASEESWTITDSAPTGLNGISCVGGGRLFYIKTGVKWSEKKNFSVNYNFYDAAGLASDSYEQNVAYKEKELSVSSAGSSSSSGSESEPFDSLTSAVEAIKNSNDAQEYTIRLLSDLSTAQNETIDLSTLSGSVILNIESYDGQTKTITASDTTKSVVTVQGTSLHKINFSNIKITGATACSVNGGGINITGGVNVTLTDCEVSNNVTSGAFGGGIFNEGNLYLLGSSAITGNKALIASVGGHNVGGSGGGIYNNNGKVFFADSAVVGDKNQSTNATEANYGNSAALHGGGIFSLGGKIYIGYKNDSTKDSAFSGGIMYNYANNHGGGIYTQDYGSDVSTVIEMSGGKIGYNGCLKDGGGIRLGGSSDSFTMSAGSIEGNKANINFSGTNLEGGGGIYAGGTTAGSVTINGGSIKNNTALKGGGISSKRRLVLNGNTQITGNQAIGTNEENESYGRGGRNFYEYGKPS